MKPLPKGVVKGAKSKHRYQHKSEAKLRIMSEEKSKPYHVLTLKADKAFCLKPSAFSFFIRPTDLLYS